MVTNNHQRKPIMTLKWKKCTVCNGYGEVIINKTRTSILKNGESVPLIDDENQKCPNCKGKGQVYTKTYSLNPWHLFRKDNKNE